MDSNLKFYYKYTLDHKLVEFFMNKIKKYKIKYRNMYSNCIFQEIIKINCMCIV